jgi:hypothetical protein
MESDLSMSRLPQKLSKLGKRLRRRLGRWGFRTLISVGLLASLSSFASAAEPVFTKSHKFRIPFQFDQAEMERIGAVEIELHVSNDQGGAWEKVSVADPKSGKFSYEARSNGEYWFSVRTIDSAGQSHPSGRLQAGLKVIVDDASPLFEMRVREMTPGKVQLTWTADDDNIDLSTLELQYRQPGSNEWELVQVRAAAQGTTTWTVTGSGLVEVRGRVSDRSGNSVAAEDAVRIGGDGPDRKASSPDFSKPVATLPDLPSANSTAQIESAPIVPPPVASRDVLPQIVSSRGPQSQFVSSSAAAAPSIVNEQFRNLPAIPAGARLVSSRTFNIGYQISDEGPSGIGEIDLYITEDGGRKWYNYGTDPDRRSPFTVTVPREGLYGFAMRARSGVGLASDPPQPAETPSIIVAVDLAPPTVRLLPIRQGAGTRLNEVTIQWNAADQALADKPIALYYSVQPNGPWEPISGWTENTGSYNWTIGNDQQRRLYIRVEARDAAGNIATATSPQPLFFDLSKPTAKIVDVEAVPTSSPR